MVPASKSMRSLTENPEILLALQPEELAEYLLRDLASGAGGQRHRHNYMLEIMRHAKADAGAIARAVTEAWAWLERENLIAVDPDQGGEWIFITRRGNRLLGSASFADFIHSSMLPKAQLHPLLASTVWAMFLRRDYDTAIFQAFKTVEVEVRSAAGLAPGDLGVALMRRAFGASGALADTNAVESEKEALAHLFAGAIGTYKNPQSHRSVNVSDPHECAEMIIFASHLLRIVDRRRPNPNPSTHSP